MQEDKISALQRELREEIGAQAEILGKVGKIEEFNESIKTHQISYCYYGKVIGEIREPDYIEEERSQDFSVIWVDLDEAIRLTKSGNFKTEKISQQFIAFRDETFLREYKKIREKDSRNKSENDESDGSRKDSSARENSLAQNDKTTIDFDFAKLLAAVKELDEPAVYATLKNADFEFDGQTLTLYFAKSFHRKKADSSKFREIINMAINKIYGETMQIVIAKTAVRENSPAAKILAIMGGGEIVRQHGEK